MTDDERDPSAVLARTRRAWAPGEADAGRVRRALGAALVAAPVEGAAAPDHASTASARVPAQTSAWASRLLVAGAIAAASGGAGYWAGHRAGLRDAPAPARSLSGPPNVAAAQPASAPAESPAADAPSLSEPSLLPSRHGGRGTRRESGPRTGAQTQSLAIELRALRNAERALRDGNAGLALAFLQELDRQVPNGQLAEERDAAATLARCARGDHPFGVSLAAEFDERHPESVYRARVEQACGETDSSRSGDSAPRRSER